VETTPKESVLRKSKERVIQRNSKEGGIIRKSLEEGKFEWRKLTRSFSSSAKGK
jgi:hypothetical protein